MAATSLLEEALDAWTYARTGLVDEIRNLSAADLKFRPHPKSRTAAELAVHVVETSAMMAGELSRPDGNFQRKTFPAFMKEYARGIRPTSNKAELVRLLKRTLAEGQRKLGQAGDIHMLQVITQFNGEPCTRLTWMHHGIAHEEYHRAQVALYARLAGRVPALTQLIHGTSG